MRDLYERLKDIREYFTRQDMNLSACAIDEAIAALRQQEPVAELDRQGQLVWTNEIPVRLGMKLYAAPVQSGWMPLPAAPVREDRRTEIGSGQVSPMDASEHQHERRIIVSGTDTPAPELSAEQIEAFRGRKSFADWEINLLCDMAMRSLTLRNEGIEAAAKHVEGFNRGMAVTIRALKRGK